MNANTACKIDDAVAQAVHCGEAEFEIREQFERSLAKAEAARKAALIGTRCECGAPYDAEFGGYACAK